MRSALERRLRRLEHRHRYVNPVYRCATFAEFDAISTGRQPPPPGIRALFPPIATPDAWQKLVADTYRH